jgi:hypothetical protein
MTADRRGRDRLLQMPGHERHHLPADLQVRHIAVQVDPIHAPHVQRHMPVQQIVHRRHDRNHDHQHDCARQRKPAPHLGGPRRSLCSYFDLKKWPIAC